MKSLPTLPLITRYAAEQPRFTLLDSVANRISLIAFCSVFSFLFMYIFLPFNINMWYEGQQLSLMALFFIFTLCGVAVLSISQFGLFRLKWRRRLTNATYLCWFMGEIVGIAVMVTMVDVMLVDTFFLTWSEFINTLRYIALILPLPYCIALLWFFTREKMAQLRSLEKEQVTKPITDPCILIRDEHDKPVLTLHPGKLLLMKAEDNYVQVFYLSGNTISKELVRTSLKKLESYLSPDTFVRAHRSYLVNISKVVLFKKNTKGHYLELEGLGEISVPVSATCLTAFQERFAPAS
ncbi:LytR/AlgR family response regulator transcription factor [Chitinophaga sp.]|uniref:LytR/AlgR family response regulator transcription factor n=1 Tax=Chitinophaga sp. TaxID=1869181 RepID=UPI002BCCC532|nr:LytTR family transcriptional regulator DNA-binding domain-containing protein [Chitinophaga sp.]HWV70007.1 LytTR family transcriptional regulator DNA-binding domain-containing protein [Chitinophaga sp.]